jgi:succinate dehydrogenase/fumarate reductase cytochrome b subunit
MVATLKTVKDNRRYLLTKALPYLFVLGLLVVCFMSVFVFARSGSTQANSGAKAGIEAVVKIIMVLLSALGALFIVLGVIKFTIAHAQEDSPSQQKAAMLIASGIALLIVGFVVGRIDFASIINTSPSYTYSGTFGE